MPCRVRESTAGFPIGQMAEKLHSWVILQKGAIDIEVKIKVMGENLQHFFILYFVSMQHYTSLIIYNRTMFIFFVIMNYIC